MTQSTDQTLTFVALNRFGLGAKPETDLAVIASDPRGFLKQELDRKSELLNAQGLLDTKSALQALFEKKRIEKMMRDQMPGSNGQAATASLPPGNSTQSGMQPTNAQPAKGMAANDMAPKDMKPMKVQRDANLNESMARFLQAYAATTGFPERLVWFWSNHFCVSTAKGQDIEMTAGCFEREAIRPHILGNFGTMLKAVEQHPAMLTFLDNQQSIGPNSKAGQRRGKGLNENLAREIMELHTLGVGSGYTQADVTSLARIVTGWTFAGQNGKEAEPGTFYFNTNFHEPGDHKLLGKVYPQNGMAQGEAALDELGTNPATAKHIAFKMARHFVSDVPPPAVVDRLTQTFMKTAGDLKAVTQALVDSDEAWASPPTKLKNPQEFLLSSLRALDFEPDDPKPLLNALNNMGEPLWRPSGPNGFGDTSDVWGSPEGIKVRLEVALLMAHKTKSQTNPNDLLAQIIGPNVSAETKQAVARAESKPQALALLLMSPEFQRR
jgi:uncharacterized protein (DUF1800 family)